MGPGRGTIGYCGVPGAFAEEACLAFAPEYRPEPLPSFREVASAVLGGRLNRGMLPLTNSIAGDVPEVAKLLAELGLTVRSRHKLAVRLHLLGAPGSKLSEIALVKSHPMALLQCKGWLDAAALPTQAEVNTAVAAQAIADSGGGHLAAIASVRAAHSYNLTVLVSDIHDDPDNQTTFGIV